MWWRNDDRVLLFHGSILELAIKIVAMMQQGKHSQPLQLSVSKNKGDFEKSVAAVGESNRSQTL